MNAIPDAAIEAAAEVLYNRQLMPDEVRWQRASDLDREEPRGDARAAIEAAMPAIEKNIREVIAREIKAEEDRTSHLRGLEALDVAARIALGGRGGEG